MIGQAEDPPLRPNRDRDIDLDCPVQDYDQCLFDYVMENGYILVTGNIGDFDPKYWAYAAEHATPGIVLISPRHHKNPYLIAEWLELLAEEQMSNRYVRI